MDRERWIKTGWAAMGAIGDASASAFVVALSVYIAIVCAGGIGDVSDALKRERQSKACVEVVHDTTVRGEKTCKAGTRAEVYDNAVVCRCPTVAVEGGQ